VKALPPPARRAFGSGNALFLVFGLSGALLLPPVSLRGQPAPVPAGQPDALEQKIGQEVTVEGVVNRLEFMPERDAYQLTFADNPSLLLLIGKNLVRTGNWHLDRLLGTSIKATGTLARQKTDLVIQLYAPGQLGLEAAARTPASTPSGPSRFPGRSAPQPETVTSMPLSQQAQYQSATIQALLVADFGSNRFGAMVNSLTLSLVPGQSQMTFSQPVGKQMQSSADSVQKAYLSKGSTLPPDQGLQLTFADKQSMKDGPSAGLPMALLLDGLLDNRAIPKEMAATGDVSPDRKVHAVGAVADKIRAAHKAGCTLILIPKENAEVLNDMALDEQWDPLLGSSIFLVDSIEQAWETIALWDQHAADSPLGLYETIAKTAKQKGVNQMAYGTHRQDLRKIAEALPNHGSARMLFLQASNTLPARYSLAGSFVKLDQALGPFTALMDELSSGRANDEQLSAHTDTITKTLDQLGAVQAKLDPRLSEYSMSVYQFINTMYEFFRYDSRAKRKSLVPELESRAQKVKESRQKLLDDPSIRDSLM
jgi:hypothetical protein